MTKVTLFFKAINKDEHLASSFSPRERGHVLTTVKRPVGQPRKRKPSAETPPRMRDLTPQRRCQSRSQVNQCQYTAKQKMLVVMRTDRTCLERSNYSNKCPPPPNVGALYVIVSTLILDALWPWNYFGGAYIRNNAVITAYTASTSAVSSLLHFVLT